VRAHLPKSRRRGYRRLGAIPPADIIDISEVAAALRPWLKSLIGLPSSIALVKRKIAIIRPSPWPMMVKTAGLSLEGGRVAV